MATLIGAVAIVLVFVLGFLLGAITAEPYGDDFDLDDDDDEESGYGV